MGHFARSVRALGLVAIAALVTVCTSGDAGAAAGRHPFYDDGGTLTWYTSLTEARVAAAREGKLIFIDYSQDNCPVCREMIEDVLPERGCGSRISAIAVGLHIDATIGNRQIYDMFRTELRNAKYLPWIAFMTPGQNWVAGMAPSHVTPRAELSRRLQRALSNAEIKHHELQTMRGDVPDLDDTSMSSGAAHTTYGVGDPDAGAHKTDGVVGVGDPDGGARVGTHRAAVTTERNDPPPPQDLQWFTRLADAQAAARRSGKMIFVMSTRPGCSLCKKLKEQVVPRMSRELARGSVAYVYDITRPESGQLDAIVRRNLPGAYVMPLAGFVTPDLRWIHGFFGKTDVETLRADYETARRQSR